jgi:MerR family transcriptional regulator, copper efflux regulator
MDPTFTIGKLSKTVGVNIQTVRYYERRRLLTPIARKPSGYRVYDEDACNRLHFIKNAQALGFTLHEIAELLSLRVNAGACCGDVLRKATKKLGQVEAKVKDLRVLAKTLRNLVNHCRARQPTTNCPILQGLEKERRSNDGDHKAKG